MEAPAIEVQNLSKCYMLGRTPVRDLREELAAFFAPRKKVVKEAFWALKDLSFTQQRGEAVGIIGRNGAGKSTLLKILSRITEPTDGRAVLRGRLASLLEVGTGFHPELSGRENIFLNGAILGMKRLEIRSAFDEIVAFSEIEQFLDTPVKHYSSGMYVRLAFAVAAHLRPEILFIDEVLAVGDHLFQKKCLGKIESMAKGGRTVLFVSHNLKAIGELCSRVIVLQKGRLLHDAAPKKAIDYYLRETLGLGKSVGNSDSTQCEIQGRNFTIHEISVSDDEGIRKNIFDYSEQINIAITHSLGQDMRGARLNMHVLTEQGDVVFALTDQIFRQSAYARGKYVSSCSLPRRLFNEDTYIIRVGATIPHVEVLIDSTEAAWFSVRNVRKSSLNVEEKFSGVIAPDVSWSVQKLGET